MSLSFLTVRVYWILLMGFPQSALLYKLTIHELNHRTRGQITSQVSDHKLVRNTQCSRSGSSGSVIDCPSRSESGSCALLRLIKFQKSLQYFKKFYYSFGIICMFFNNHKNVQEGSVSLIYWPPGFVSIIQAGSGSIEIFMIRNPSWTMRFPNCRFFTNETTEYI